MDAEQVAGLVTVFVTVGSAVLATASVVSAIYIAYVYRQRQGEALFLTRLVHRDIRVSAASAVILIYLVLALTDHSLGKPWGALVIGLALWAMMVGPITDALLWWKERRVR